MKTFYLGTHMPGWLNWSDVPLFVSDRRLRVYKTLPRAASPWALDSGGFTELSTHGNWDYGPTPAEYVARVARYAHEVGRLKWAASQDWMCEPHIVAKTGLSVREHQWRSTDSLVILRDLAPRYGLAPSIFVPVVQGFEIDEYLRHVDIYRAIGIDLTAEPLVGVGSVCRRQGSEQIRDVFRNLGALGLRMHGFGLKTQGLLQSADLIESADSMAWSYNARRNPRLEGCTAHATCANCPRWAARWRERMLSRVYAA